ncbi:AAA family ATPase [Micropruina glycogenica]|nr:AAA family ATPase [Micropruina glycogenica]
MTIVRLPNGVEILGDDPVVLIGPNGSGKTRQSRSIGADGAIDFVNALRNTRVAPELPVMGVDAARNNFTSQKEQARGQFWELSSEFDYMLSQLLAQYAGAAIRFSQRVRTDPSAAADGPEATPLLRIEELWANVFPGRQLDWSDWKPIVTSTTTGSLVSYSGNQMSDGEKAALFLAGRVFTFDGGVLVVDEPETHFHTLLAVRFWNALEAARPDVRFVYVTHDLSFALSRRNPTFVLASPTQGLRKLELDDDLPDDLAEALLGSASLSFYASRVVFTEGTESSYDAQLYGAWFNGPDTVVKPVQSAQDVMRCVAALQRSGIARALSATGIIDRDHHPDEFLGSLPPGTVALPVHEVESLFALPDIVIAVARHLNAPFDHDEYLARLRASVSVEQREALAIQRWKARIEPQLAALTAGVKNKSVAQLLPNMANHFAVSNWPFDPSVALREAKQKVDDALSDNSGAAEMLAVIPGKQLLPLAAATLGQSVGAYVNLIVSTLKAPHEGNQQLSSALTMALASKLPARSVPPVGVPAPLTES